MRLTDDSTLRALVDRLIPADEFPSGWDSGAGEFLERLFAADLAGSAQRLTGGLEFLNAAAVRRGAARFADLDSAGQDAVIAGAEGREFLHWITGLVMQGFYGDPGNGGNRDGLSWQAIGYRELPRGVQGPGLPLVDSATRTAAEIGERYDAIVIGAGRVAGSRPACSPRPAGGSCSSNAAERCARRRPITCATRVRYSGTRRRPARRSREIRAWSAPMR